MKHIKLYESFLNEASEKFTFKTEKPTGKWRSFESDTHHIKLNKKEVGSIMPDKPFKIRLMVMKDEAKGITDNNPNCPWKWITLKKESNSLEEAKEWLNANIAGIRERWPLRMAD